MSLVTAIEGHDLVGYWPGVSSPVARVHLPTLARRLAARGVYGTSAVQDHHFDHLGGVVEVGRFGSRLKKFGKKVKKGLKKTVAVAKKVVTSKAFKAITGVMSAVIPQPLGAVVGIAATAIPKAAKLVKSRNPKHKKLAAKARDVATGKASAAELDHAAKKAGVKPEAAREVAAVLKLHVQAQHDPKAKAALQLAETLKSAKREADAGKVGPSLRKAAASASLARNATSSKGPRVVRQPGVEAQLRAQFPRAIAYTVTHNDGRRFNTIVVPA
jgi:hypothetical protein